MVDREEERKREDKEKDEKKDKEKEEKKDKEKEEKKDKEKEEKKDKERRREGGLLKNLPEDLPSKKANPPSMSVFSDKATGKPAAEKIAPKAGGDVATKKGLSVSNQNTGNAVSIAERQAAISALAKKHPGLNSSSNNGNKSSSAPSAKPSVPKARPLTAAPVRPGGADAKPRPQSASVNGGKPSGGLPSFMQPLKRAGSNL